MTSRLWKANTAQGERFIEAFVENPAGALLAFDFDGTLAPIVEDPEDSRLHDDAAESLGVIAGRVAQLAIITGRGVEAVRRLGELDSRPGLSSLVVLGQYGVERWDAATGKVRHPDVPAGIREAWGEVEAVVTDVERSGVDVSGVYLEDKERAIGIHTRRTSDPQGVFDALVGPVRELTQRHDLVLEPGRAVLEIRAASQDKGDALRELLEEVKPSIVAMVGDDLGDIPAFEALGELQKAGMICARVVSASSEERSLDGYADIRCEGPDGVAEWVADLTARLG